MGDEPEALAVPFRELFEMSPDAILLFSAGVVTHANPAAITLLRAPSIEALIGRKSSELVAPEHHAAVEGHVSAIMQGQRSASLAEERYLRLDGTYIHVEATAARATFLPGKAFIVILRDVSIRKEAEARAQREREAAVAAEREQWLREIIDLLPNIVFARDKRGAFVLVNRKCAEFYQRSREECLGRTMADLGVEEAEQLAAEDRDIIATGIPRFLPEREVTDGEGRKRIFEGVKMLLRLGQSGEPAVLGAMTELTERRQLEAQLLHAQKMEGIGRLAGGVAHDFNNLLTVILESADHLSRRVTDSEGDIGRIREASMRAASLIRQLLAFARQAPVEFRIVEIDDLVRETAHLLARVLGEDVTLTTDLRAARKANVDPRQLEVVLMNLAVNARDAMPDGGKLVITTRAVEERTTPEESPRPCVVIEVRDTGCGMDEATLARAFEPFFTTKELGQGTGLGLSTSYGILSQLGGSLRLASVVGAGTIARVLLPACAPGESASLRRKNEAPAPRGSETVLLLEDDHAVRRATLRMLRSLGYTVLDAALPSEALTIARDHPDAIDVLVTDVIMPQMNGVEAARAFRALRPDAAVLFVSGYSDDALASRTDTAGTKTLGKPFTQRELANALRELIEAARA